ncbi:hypothetical protein GY21_12475 [Cryobacterium roopkundense]|uniref:Uncharacterized protein n=1 Tax=Cryobacterium roopkundense TaxID=1001240 RepID=A0A099J352_9MICO|nr:hypothetical protein GY21_12475 [Cryobacterium roopkundense]
MVQVISCLDKLDNRPRPVTAWADPEVPVGEGLLVPHGDGLRVSELPHLHGLPPQLRDGEGFTVAESLLFEGLPGLWREADGPVVELVETRWSFGRGGS